jgi:hypothetical protein
MLQPAEASDRLARRWRRGRRRGGAARVGGGRGAIQEAPELEPIEELALPLEVRAGVAQRLEVRRSPILPLTRPSAAAFSTPSRSPCSPSSLAAVLGPQPFTPGTLSEVSPARASMSAIFDGGTPCLASTSAGP